MSRSQTVDSFFAEAFDAVNPRPPIPAGLPDPSWVRIVVYPGRK
jgi:hypothetical protein